MNNIVKHDGKAAVHEEAMFFRLRQPFEDARGVCLHANY